MASASDGTLRSFDLSAILGARPVQAEKKKRQIKRIAESGEF